MDATKNKRRNLYEIHKFYILFSCETIYDNNTIYHVCSYM